MNKESIDKDKIKEFFDGRAIFFTMLSVLLLISVVFNVSLVVKDSQKDTAMDEVLTVLGTNEGIIHNEDKKANDKKIEKTVDWLNSELDGTFYANYDNQAHSITLEIVGKGLVNDFNGTMSGRIPATAWDGLFESMTNLSETLCEKAGDENISLTMLSPIDNTVGFFVAENGKLMFDGFESIGLK